jgi:hypothetical protein
VDGYSDYGGVAIEVRVLNRDGKPVPGVLVRTHAFNTDFTDSTGSDGAFRRDGFSQPITWEVSLPKERARPLNVKLEWQKLAVATFRLQPCK